MSRISRKQIQNTHVIDVSTFVKNTQKASKSTITHSIYNARTKKLLKFLHEKTF